MEHDEQHPREALQDAADHRLEPAKLAELLAHVASCLDCRRELDALRWTKARAASARSFELPSGFEARLREALDREDRGRRRAFAKLVPWIAAAAALAAAIGLSGRFWKRSIPEEVAGDFRAYRSNALPLAARSASAAELEAFFAGRGLPFRMRVFDLAMMEYALEGAAVREVAGRAGALVAYRGPDGLLLLCRMYEGSVSDLPDPIERRTNDSIDFYLHREGELTLVFWQEGGVVCVLVGDGDPEAVLGLAFAKAVRV